MSKHKRYSGNGRATTYVTRGKGTAAARVETLRRREVRAIKYASASDLSLAVTR